MSRRILLDAVRKQRAARAEAIPQHTDSYGIRYPYTPFYTTPPSVEMLRQAEFIAAVKERAKGTIAWPPNV